MPDVRKLTLAEAQARVEAQPLTAELVYKPAAPLQRPGIVVDQRPGAATARRTTGSSSSSRRRPQGVIPNLVGRDIADARLRLKRLKLEPAITWVEGGPGECCEQKTRPGLAAAPGVKVRARRRALAATAAAG